jgi:hypothetical protein
MAFSGEGALGRRRRPTLIVAGCSHSINVAFTKNNTSQKRTGTLSFQDNRKSYLSLCRRRSNGVATCQSAKASFILVSCFLSFMKGHKRFN